MANKRLASCKHTHTHGAPKINGTELRYYTSPNISYQFNTLCVLHRGLKSNKAKTVQLTARTMNHK